MEVVHTGQKDLHAGPIM